MRALVLDGLSFLFELLRVAIGHLDDLVVVGHRLLEDLRDWHWILMRLCWLWFWCDVVIVEDVCGRKRWRALVAFADL
jgi:hypothetical protein